MRSYGKVFLYKINHSKNPLQIDYKGKEEWKEMTVAFLVIGSYFPWRVGEGSQVRVVKIQ